MLTTDAGARRSRTAVAAALACAALAAMCLTAPRAHAEDVSHPCSPRVSITSFSDALDKSTVSGRQVSGLSALAVDPAGGRVSALSDRSTLLELSEDLSRATSLVRLTDRTGRTLDSEALVVQADGSRLIASENEPSITRHAPDGSHLDTLEVPGNLRVYPRGPAWANRTFEGLSVHPAGHTLIASMEGAITGDSSTVRRLQTWDHDAAADRWRPARQYGYRADAGLDISDIAATGDGRLLVVERGYSSRRGSLVRLYLADPAKATDVRTITSLTSRSSAALVPKTLMADLGTCPSLGARALQPQDNPLLDNIEGMTVTGRTRQGHLRLLLVSDDNGSHEQITRLYRLTASLPPRA
ncbi:esterase-like activity of phytase family protein [Streptomyces sp. NPDC085932]|uniref:esterase-like activity of phytase family protein n=1 Tax=Streptomyces sp. NPDC085932 TaxID=3365741 RepID=UPI0037D103FD